MKTLQRVICEKGIENVKIQFVGDIHFTPTENAICRLEKYWADDDYSNYVHKIKVVEDKPYIIKTLTGDHEYPAKNFAFYMSDLEQYFEKGEAKIIKNEVLNNE